MKNSLLLCILLLTLPALLLGAEFGTAFATIGNSAASTFTDIIFTAIPILVLMQGFYIFWITQQSVYLLIAIAITTFIFFAKEPFLRGEGEVALAVISAVFLLAVIVYAFIKHKQEDRELERRRREIAEAERSGVHRMGEMRPVLELENDIQAENFEERTAFSPNKEAEDQILSSDDKKSVRKIVLD